MRVGLYARVSTHDQHTLPLQWEAMHAYVTARGWTVVKHIEDVGSGVAQRPHREALMKMARHRELDVIVVWRLDRWGRSLADLAGTLTELSALGGAHARSNAIRIVYGDDPNGCRILPPGCGRPQ